MSVFFFCTLTLAILASCHVQEPTLKTKLGASLEATTSIREQNTCLDETEVLRGDTFVPYPSVRSDVVLGIRFRNVGNYPIIIDMNSGAISGYEIAHTVRDASMKKYESGFIFDILTTGEGRRIEDVSPSEPFIVLGPNQSHDVISQMSVLLDSPDKYRHYTETPHFLQFKIRTGDGTLHRANDLDELRGRWLKDGYLWVEEIESLPMSIQFPDVEKLRKCVQ